MQTPLQLTFRGMLRSDALVAHLEKRAGKLEQVFERIISCHVVVKRAGHHRQSGGRYEFMINLGLPGHEIVVSRGPPEDHDPESPYVGADRAFEEAERQLEDWLRRQREHRREEAPTEPSGRILS